MYWWSYDGMIGWVEGYVGDKVKIEFWGNCFFVGVFVVRWNVDKDEKG